MVKYSTKIIFSMVTLILIGVASWSFYSLINQGATDILTSFGINNFYIQSVILIIIVIGTLLLIGLNSKKILKGIVG